MTGPAVDLDDTSHCPLGDRCDRCGDTDGLALATAGSGLGVDCLTLCTACRGRGAIPKAPPIIIAQQVLQHCEHLGIDLDQMADAMEAHDA